MKSARTLAAYLPVNLATVLVAFGGIVVLTRLLSPEEYGRYALAMVTMMFVHMSAFTWLEAAVARFTARAEREGDEATLLRTVYAGAGLVGCVGVGLACAVVLLLPLSQALTTVLLAAMVTTGLQLALNLGFEAHKAAHRIGRYSAVYSWHQTFGFLIGVGLVLFTTVREAGIFYGIGVSALVAGAIELPFMRARLRGGRVKARRLRAYFAYGAPISLSLVLSYALNSGDLYVITALLGEAEAGAYSAGYNLANRGMDVLFIWIGMAMTPLAVTAHEQDGPERSVEIMRTYAVILFALTLPAATGLALVAEPLGFVLGEGVRAKAVAIIPWIAFAGLLNGFMSYYVQRAFMLSAKTGVFALLLIPPAIVNIALNLLLVPRLGLQGAVWATLAAYALCLGVTWIAARRHYSLPLPLGDFVRIALATAVMAIVVRALPEGVRALPDAVEVGLIAAVGAGVFVTACLGLDVAGARERVCGWLADARQVELVE